MIVCRNNVSVRQKDGMKDEISEAEKKLTMSEEERRDEERIENAC